jgi:hypothetical protein
MWRRVIKENNKYLERKKEILERFFWIEIGLSSSFYWIFVR